MQLPLIISDSDGRILYKSRTVKTDGFLQLWNKVSAKNVRDGLVIASGKAYYIKEAPLCGKNYIFFMDYEKLGEHFGVDAESIASDLFSLEKLPAERREVKLKELVSLFAENFSKAFYTEGIRMTLHPLADNAAVDVSPRAFVLVLALMTRLSAEEGKIVEFSFTSECGRIVIFCDGSGNKRIGQGAKEMLEVLLYEVAAAASFAVEKTVTDGVAKYALELSPLDIALLGLKTARDKATEGFCAAYVEMFL